MTTDFSLAADDYLVTRRAMEYKLEIQGRLLHQFVDYLQSKGAKHLTLDHAASWARQPSGGAATYLAYRLGVVRPFARYLSTLDPATEVPPAGLFPEPSHRIVPTLDLACDEEPSRGHRVSRTPFARPMSFAHAARTALPTRWSGLEASGARPGTYRWG
ncbi:MAG: hypothetical protein ACRD0Z_07215 [Acidimicrobiales bacterium]